MTLIRALWRWLTTPRKDTTQEDLKAVADQHERDRKVGLATLPKPLNLSSDPGTDVPTPHLGQVQHVDLTKPLPPRAQAPSHLEQTAPSDFDLLPPEEQALFTDLGHDPTKTIRLPAPVEQSTADWVTEQLAKAGYSEAYHLRFLAFRRVGIGMSMRYLGDLKRRADARDSSLSVHQLIALRSRGIA